MGRIALWFGLMTVLTIVMLAGWVLWGDARSVASLKWLQLIQTFALFILPALCAVWLWSPQPMAWLHLDRGFSWQTALWAIGIMLVAVPGINLLSHLNEQMTLPAFLAPLEAYMKAREADAKHVTELFLKADEIGTLLINIVLMALLPAVGEELTFRGVLQGLFSQKHRITAIWVTAAIFSFVHFQFYGFVPRMLMGALFGYVLLWTGSLWVPMLMHFTNNALAVLSYYIADLYHIESETIDSLGYGDTWWLGTLSLVAVVLMCKFPSFSQVRNLDN